VKAGIKAKREKAGTWGRKALAGNTQEKIRELISEKHSIRSIAKMLGISTKTVMKYGSHL
jgi:DNA invertase Pin-like site-specific DNA recombinase